MLLRRAMGGREHVLTAMPIAGTNSPSSIVYNCITTAAGRLGSMNCAGPGNCIDGADAALTGRLPKS
jgi:hypothetical protein